MSEIFKSNFTLKFKNPAIENIYVEMANKTMRKYNIIYSIINLAISITYCLIYSFTYHNLMSHLYFYLKYTTYALTGIHTICLINSIVLTNYTMQKWISWINVSAIFINCLGFRIYVGSVAQLDTVILLLVFTIQQIYVMAWFFTNSLDFFDGFWVYLLVSFASWAYYATVLPLKLQFRLIISGVIIMISSLISYFYVHEKKKSFYLAYQNELTIKSFVSIIQNMNSGFLSLKNYKIISLNKTINFHLTKIVQKLNNNNDNNLLNENSMIKNENIVSDFPNLSVEKTKLLLAELFNGIVIDSLNGPEEDQPDFTKTLEYIKNYNYNNVDQKENFFFIGTKTFINEQDKNSSQYYEIFGRYCDRFKQEKEENYEFIFNDVSKSKIREEINADMKYKTIFLSKVAHEFKNPLLCIAELIDQISEELHSQCLDSFNLSDSNKTSRAIKNLTHIKSMCEYMLILVKDLDFFSLQFPGSTNKIKLEMQTVKMERVIDYCNNITKVLLKKFSKEENIRFQIDCPQELYEREILTDEVRLKQLLINFLSNSVKYTNNGSITLEIKEEHCEMKFSVIDTGKGLTEEQKIRLDKNLIDNREIGEYSSGLGFSIIKELINLLGSHLYYETNENLGSKFSFSLKLIPQILENNLYILNENERIPSNSDLSETLTVGKSLCPMEEHDTILKITEKAKDQLLNTTLKVVNKELGIDLIKAEADTDYYLVVDDEKLTRESTIRVLNNYITSSIRNSRKTVILQASDGTECLNVFYQCMKKGIKLSFIITDQTMAFMNGEFCARVLNDIIKINSLKHIPLFIVTAYENFNFSKEIITKSFTKPIKMVNINEIFSLISEY